MDNYIRINFRLVVPLIIALVVVYWILHRSGGNEQASLIKHLQGVIKQQNLEIDKIRERLLSEKRIQVPTDSEQEKKNELPKHPEPHPSVEAKESKGNDITKDADNYAKPLSLNRSFAGQKLVHLDLKGAPPKMDYLVQLIPVIKSWGASGFLVEYEDMFPYDQDLSVLKSPYAYSLSEITRLLTEIKKNNLLVVPLVQTFGHMEFVLKHNKFAHLRHVAHITNAVDPSNNGSIPLVKSMIDQIIKVHKPYAKYLHIGGDEVWSLRPCQDCEASSDVYLGHMLPVIDHVVSSQLIPILWDDMMRTWNVEDLKKMSSKHVEPMVWAYRPQLYRFFPEGMWYRYGQAFDRVWIASAFKGAESADTNYVKFWDRIDNHQSWLKISVELYNSDLKVSGIALTGWSRYDHYAALCELLPVSLPSLALCLAVLKEGEMSDEILSTVSRQLGFKDLIHLNSYRLPVDLEKLDEGTFPGHSVFGMVLILQRAYIAVEAVKTRMLGWFTERHIAKKSFSVYHFTNCMKKLDGALFRLKKVKAMSRKTLAPFFNHDTIDEWIWDKVDSKLHDADKMKQRLTELKTTAPGKLEAKKRDAMT